MNYDEHFKTSCERRDALWNSIGELYTDVVGNLINPSFMGGPRWPSLRQAHRGVKVNDKTIITTDGLSDPYDDFDTNEENRPYNGLGLEVYGVSENQLADIPAIIESWELTIIRQVSNIAASNPNLVNMLAKYHYVSTTVNGEGLPNDFVDENGESGVLLGLESKLVPKKVELSIEEVSLVNVVLLTSKELAFIVENGAEARKEVAQKLTTQGYTTLVKERPSVV